MADPRREELVRKMVAEGTNDDDIRKTLAVFDAQQQPTAQATPAAQPGIASRLFSQFTGVSPSEYAQAAKTGLRFIADHPVGTGAVVGSTLATGGASIPAEIGLAALGAAGGSGYGLLAKGAQTGDFGTPGGNAATMAKEGAAAAAGQGVGEGVNQALQKGAKLVYKTALRPSMALQRNFGDLAGAGLQEGLPVSEAGYNAAEQAGKASNQRAVDLLRAADAKLPNASGLISAQEIANHGVPKLLQDAANAPFPQTTRNALTQLEQQFVGERPSGMTLMQTNALKQKAQDLANSAYRAAERGAPVTASFGNITDPAFNQQIARGARQAIETRVPEIGPINQRTQTLIGLQQALENATMRNVPGVGSLRSLLGDFIPGISSRVAIGVNRAAPTTPSLLAALAAALSPQTPQQGGQ